MQVPAPRSRPIGPPSVIIGRIEPHRFVVRGLPLKRFLRGSRSAEREGPQECQCKCGFHSDDSIWSRKKLRNCPKGQVISTSIVFRWTHPGGGKNAPRPSPVKSAVCAQKRAELIAAGESQMYIVGLLATKKRKFAAERLCELLAFYGFCMAWNALRSRSASFCASRR